MTRNLSSSVLEKFNDYETIRHELACQEKRKFVPIDIVYEPIYDESVPPPCFFTDQISLAYRSCIGRVGKGKEQILHRTVRQSHYCENYFSKNDDTMKKHLQVCTAKGDITYSFDNGQIITFQDNFKYLGDIPFAVYFDFETTTGDSVFFVPKMFVVSYCQIYSSHPALGLDKIVIFRSFQQSAEEMYDLSNFKQEHVAFFNKTTFFQLKDAASAMLAREKSTSLAELFWLELKLTNDTLNDWFSNVIKPSFFELNDIKKRFLFRKI